MKVIALCGLFAALNIFCGVLGLLSDTNPILIALNFSVALLFCFVYQKNLLI